jgi:hypothetical protein
MQHAQALGARPGPWDLGDRDDTGRHFWLPLNLASCPALFPSFRIGLSTRLTQPSTFDYSIKYALIEQVCSEPHSCDKREFNSEA